MYNMYIYTYMYVYKHGLARLRPKGIALTLAISFLVPNVVTQTHTTSTDTKSLRDASSYFLSYNIQYKQH